MILVVSDVHLGFDDCNREAFSKFLDEYQDKEIDHLALLRLQKSRISPDNTK